MASASTPSWGKVVSLTAAPVGDYSMQAVADPAGGALLYYPSNGVPTVARVSATGAVGAPAPVPAAGSLGNAGTPGSIAFLSNGAAVVSWDLGSGGQYGEYFAYRAANGTWGKPVSAGQMSSFAVQPGEILVAEDDNVNSQPGLGIVSRKVSSNGTIGAPSADKQVYKGQLLFNQSWLVLDPSGSAELVADNSNVQTVFRTAKGVWGSTKVLSTGTDVQSVTVSSAPSGRAIVGWVQVTGSYAASTVYAAIRDAGSDFGAPVSTGEDDAMNVGGNLAYARVAAGPDGTLAVGTTLEVQALDSSYSDTNSVELAGPSQHALGSKHTITGTVSAFTISSLGAGDSKAIVGTVQQNYGPQADNGSYHESQLTSATTVSSTATTSHTFGTSSGTYDGNGGAGCGCALRPPALSVAGVSLDAHGFGAAIGILKPGGPISYSIEAAKAAPKVTVAAKATATATASHVSDTISCAAATCKGTLTVTVGKKKAASASYSIKAGKHARVSAKLTAAGKKAFAHAKKHRVTATLRVTVKGGATVTKKITVA